MKALFSNFIFIIVIIVIFIFRLEEKFSDIESENQILRQQTFLTPVKKAPEHPTTPATQVNLYRWVDPHPLSISSFWFIFVYIFFCYLQRQENGHYASDEDKANVITFFSPHICFFYNLCLYDSTCCTLSSFVFIEKSLFLQESQSATPVKKFTTESDSKFRRSNAERQHVCV